MCECSHYVPSPFVQLPDAQMQRRRLLEKSPTLLALPLFHGKHTKQAA